MRDFQDRNRDEAAAALTRLEDVAMCDGNVFAVLVQAARVCSLLQVTEAFFGGRPVPLRLSRKPAFDPVGGGKQ